MSEKTLVNDSSRNISFPKAANEIVVKEEVR